ncbi:hypothetical protein F5X97DRAFT_343970 [Nemania serpens]|nr:hypothetical protein F5X97DRAFT_343970 [Nemania serpens]
MSSRTANIANIANIANAPQQPDNLRKRDRFRNHIKNIAKGPKNLARAVVDWATRPEPAPLVRDHPSWPQPYGTGNQIKFKLETQAYTGQTIAESTIAQFFPTRDDRNLTPQQLEARRQIKLRYRAFRLKNTCEPSDIKQFVKLFDQFFFFGSMTSGARARIATYVWERDSPMLSSHARGFLEPGAPYGFTRERHIKGYGPFCEVHIAGQSFYDSHKPLSFFLETLIHEMVHAYLNLRICHCARCSTNVLNTTGITGHGPTFLMVLDCIHQTMASWNLGLTGLAQERVTRNGRPVMMDEVYLLVHSEAKLLQDRMRACLGRSHAAEQASPAGNEPRTPQTAGPRMLEGNSHPAADIMEPRPPRDGSSPLAEEIARSPEARPAPDDRNRVGPPAAEEPRRPRDPPQPPRGPGAHMIPVYVTMDEAKRQELNRIRNRSDLRAGRAQRPKITKKMARRGLTVTLRLDDRANIARRAPDMDVYMLTPHVNGTVIRRRRLIEAGDDVQFLIAARSYGRWRRPRRL